MLRIRQYGKQELKLKLLMIWSLNLRTKDSVREFAITPSWSINEINYNYNMSDVSCHLMLLSFIGCINSSGIISYYNNWMLSKVCEIAVKGC